MNEEVYLEQKNKMIGENLFMKKLLKKRLNQKGLTLIELLAVIVILAIVAAIAVPAIGNIISRSQDRAILSEASNILNGAKLAHTEGQCDDAAGVITCEEGDLGTFVDGATGDYSASRTAAGEWSVVYSRFGEINDTTTYDIGDTNTVTETALNTYLQD